MSLKLFGLFVLVVMTGSLNAQSGNIDSLLKNYDSVSTIPDTLADKIDTSNKTLIGQTKVADTSRKNVSNTAQQTGEKEAMKKVDKRWFISPLLKFQAQEFGMLEKQRKYYESDAQLLPFNRKSNISAAASVYKNFTKNISMSIDLGLSMGHITSKDSLIGRTKRKTYSVSNATIYYHLLGGQYKLQPFIAAGINNALGDASYTSAPVGAGVKFTGKKLMVEAQGAYGYALSSNIANTLMYSLGVYIPLKSKKEKKREAEEKAKRDSAAINITNITNNYYLLNRADSIKKAQQDSVDRAKQVDEQLVGDTATGELDADDPMRLPEARKFIVYFEYDQYALRSGAFNVVDRVISLMKENKSLNVHLKGHTDMAGSEQYNAPLSKKRARMIFDYMNSRGIPSERIVLSGYGKKSPAVKNEDPNTAWMNRRCEMVLFLGK